MIDISSSGHFMVELNLKAVLKLCYDLFVHKIMYLYYHLSMSDTAGRKGLVSHFTCQVTPVTGMHSTLRFTGVKDH